jgi:hypothetical protein
LLLLPAYHSPPTLLSHSEVKDEYEEEEEGDDEGWDEEELSDMPSSSVQALSDPDQIMASVRAILGRVISYFVFCAFSQN